MKKVKINNDMLNSWLHSYEVEEDIALRRGEIPAPESILSEKSLKNLKKLNNSS